MRIPDNKQVNAAAMQFSSQLHGDLKKEDEAIAQIGMPQDDPNPHQELPQAAPNL